MTSHWVDGTTWNFSNWDFGNPTKLWKTCSALSPIGEEPLRGWESVGVWEAAGL